MPRPYKPAPARREELLSVAARLFAERGYADTSVQAIIDALGLSKGAFYHHFDSKADLIDALVAKQRDQLQAVMAPIVSAPDTPAPEKLLALMRAANAWKLDRRPLMLDLARALADPRNLALQQRHRSATRETLTPLLAAIITQGAQEGSFDVGAPGPTAEILWLLMAGFGESIAPLLLTPSPSPARIEEVRAAYAQAVERLLGAAPGHLTVFEAEALRPWLGDTPAQRS